jgi:hypothetical protein
MEARSKHLPRIDLTLTSWLLSTLGMGSRGTLTVGVAGPIILAIGCGLNSPVTGMVPGKNGKCIHKATEGYIGGVLVQMESGKRGAR